MTREEAVEQLKINRPYAYTELREAVDMAIEALQTEPCEDAISRQAVLDILDRHTLSRMALYEIEDLPSVQPEQRTGTWKIVEVLHGEWEGTKKYACDKCGEKVGVFKSNYCPNCGCRMEEGE